MNKNPISRMSEVARRLNGEYRVSRRGVPHVLITRGGVTYSVCYFKRSNLYRVFYPYGSSNQERRDFATLDDLTGFFDHMGVTLYQCMGCGHPITGPVKICPECFGEEFWEIPNERT